MMERLPVYRDGPPQEGDIIMESENIQFNKGDILLDSAGRRMRVVSCKDFHAIVQYGWRAWLQYWWNWLIRRPVAATLCGRVHDA